MANDILEWDDEYTTHNSDEEVVENMILRENTGIYLQTYRYNFTQVWQQIRDRLHENSGLHNPRNPVGILFDLTLGSHLDAFEDFIDEHVLMGFILTSGEVHLDRFAEEYGLSREDDESDEDLRQRIFNRIVFEMSIVFLDRQGFRNYAKGLLDSDSREFITSLNPHSNNVYDSVPVTSVSRSFLLEQFLYEYTCNPHWKGW